MSPCTPCTVCSINPEWPASTTESWWSRTRKLAATGLEWTRWLRVDTAPLARPISLANLDDRTLRDINAPHWLQHDLALQHQTRRLDDLHFKARYPHWV